MNDAKSKRNPSGPARSRPGESGQAAVLIVLAMAVFLIGALGLAFDGSQLYGHRQMAQAAADAAAQAAILSIFHGTNTTASSPFAAGTAFTCSTTSGTTPCVYARLNGFGGSTGDTVSVSFPASVSGVTLASFPYPVLQVIVRRNVTTALFGFIGSSSFNVATSATAALVKSAVTNCVTTLDSSANAAFSISGNASLNLSTCGIAVDSSSSSAFSANGNVSVTASEIDVVGGARQTGNVSITPTPTTSAPSVSDPFASVPAPSFNPSVCNFTNYSVSGKNTVTLSPGTYCGGMSFGGNSTISFNPGTYILLGGGLSASGNVSLSGSNLTFYNTFNATYPYGVISIAGNLTANLSATTSGSLEGMLFFQDRAAPLGGSQSFVGNSSSNLTGALYFPRSALDYTGNSSSGLNVAIVADTVSFVGNASLTYNPNAPGAATQTKVALVQ